MKQTTAEQSVDPAALALLTSQVRSLLAFHQEFGLSRYPDAPALRTFLAQAQAVPSAPSGCGTAADCARERYGPSAAFNAAERSVKTSVRTIPKTSDEAPLPRIETVLAAVAEDIAVCQRCASAAVPVGRNGNNALPGLGSADPRLVAVGDCCIGAASGGEMIWGREEDELFWKMMAAIGLDRKTVYVTNAVKCPQHKALRPGAEAEQRCSAFLEQELLAIRPKLLCAMGDTAVRMLLSTETPLVRLRGRFHLCRCGTDGHEIRARVMPTFHPRFLLRHPEMKRAAWEDLQALQKQL